MTKYESKFWSQKLLPFTQKSNAIATRQVLLTLIPFALFWYAYSELVQTSIWFFIPFAFVISFFILRTFVLMHDCGHNSLFNSRRANKIVGFFLGVITGMPQAVWAKNHDYHHKTNGDWVSYGGVFNIINTEEYLKMTEKQKKNYWRFRQPLILIPAGFFYVLAFPRINWVLGHLVIAFKIIAALFSFNFGQVVNIVKNWESKYWKSKKDYLHMTYNNIVLIAIWILMVNAIGATEFFLLYIVSTSLSGSMGILAFTIQHNFENSYATDSERVNYYQAALEGTSMLVLPKILNWFTADIAYHHLHHLSVAIPNYRLEDCHNSFSELFQDIKKVRVSELITTFEYQLWDPKLERVVSRKSVDGLEASPELSIH